MKLLVAYDAAFAEPMLAQIVKFAKAFDAYVYVVRTCPADAGSQDIAKLEFALNEFRTNHLKPEGIVSEAKVLIRGVEPGEDMVRFSREKNVDMILIGVVRRSKVGKLIFGSIAQHIIMNAHCPVMSVQ